MYMLSLHVPASQFSFRWLFLTHRDVADGATPETGGQTYANDPSAPAAACDPAFGSPFILTG